MPAVATSSVTLTPDQAQEIWGKALAQSAVAKLATKHQLSAAGSVIDLYTTRPVAAVVAEGAKKPVGNPGVASKLLKPEKIALVVVFNEEVVNNKAALTAALVNDLPSAIQIRIDEMILKNDMDGAGTATVATIDDLAGATAASGATAYDAMMAANLAIAAQGGNVNGYIVNGAGLQSALSKSINNVPVFPPTQGIGQLGVYGQPIVPIADGATLPVTTPATWGYAGDWRRYHLGYYGGIRVKYSDNATIVDGATTHYLFQENKVAYLVELYVGGRAEDLKYFNVLKAAA